MVAAHPSADLDALLDWNESPIGPPVSAVKRVIDAADRLHRYPRGLMEEVTARAAEHFGVATDSVLLTAGVDEAVDCALTLADRGWGVEPGFDGYRDRVEANGKPFRPIPLGPDWLPGDLDPAPGAGDMVFLAQPGNPTGNLLRTEWIETVRATAAYVFLDETYQEFSSGTGVLPGRGGAAGAGTDPRLLVYRSFAKAAGLAGIRIGCLIGAAPAIARLTPLRRFMPIDAVSLNAVAGLLEEPEFLDRLAAHVRAARPALCATLRGSGLFADVRTTEANFVLARPRGALGALVDGLAEDRIRVKDCAPLGLPGWLRISVGSWEDQDRLAAALTRLRSLTPDERDTEC